MVYEYDHAVYALVFLIYRLGTAREHLCIQSTHRVQSAHMHNMRHTAIRHFNATDEISIFNTGKSLGKSKKQ